jgi:hypothetical protein
VSGTPEEGKIPPPQTGIKDLATAQRIVASIEKEEDAAASLPSSIQVNDQLTQEEANASGEQPPPMPDVSGLQAGQTKDLGDGQRVTVNQDGTVSYSGGFGVYTYDNTGAAIDYKSPSFAGLSQSKNLKTGQTSQRYLAGPMDLAQTKDAKGNVVKTSAKYDIGTGVMGTEQEKGITSKSWAPRSAEADPISQKDLYAMGNADKAATYDRAMKQVQGVKESAELEAMLRIAGLR